MGTECVRSKILLTVCGPLRTLQHMAINQHSLFVGLDFGVVAWLHLHVVIPYAPTAMYLRHASRTRATSRILLLCVGVCGWLVGVCVPKDCHGGLTFATYSATYHICTCPKVLSSTLFAEEGTGASAENVFGGVCVCVCVWEAHRKILLLT